MTTELGDLQPPGFNVAISEISEEIFYLVYKFPTIGLKCLGCHKEDMLGWIWSVLILYCELWAVLQPETDLLDQDLDHAL